MSAVTRRNGPSTGAYVALLAAAIIMVGILGCWTIVQWMHTGVADFVNPVDAIAEKRPWTGAHTAVCMAFAVAAVLFVVSAIVSAVRGDRAKEDRAARFMGKGKEIAPLLQPAITKLHNLIGLDTRIYKGVLIGYLVLGGVPIRAPFEATMTLIAGPGSRKTVGIVIPNVLDAPGTVITTSVKDDVLKATIGYRSSVGRVHVFDPQGIAPSATEYLVWVNLLRGIHKIEDSEELAAVFAANYVDGGGGENKFFEQEGVRLVADYLFAAAHAGLYLPVVYEWFGRDDSPVPARLLAEAYPAIAARIQAAQAVTERTRSGIFAYARGAIAFLASEGLRASVQPGNGRSELDPAQLVAAPRDTLYLMSKEGRGSAGPLVSALTKRLLDEAERLAERSPGGRLPVPLLVPLDEAGNICRIPDLPDRYSHYRARLIIVITILQSQEQGEQVWPNGGFGKLWAASTHQMYAGGNASVSFYEDLVKRIGPYEYSERANVRGGQPVKRSENIMDVSDLDALTRGRLVVFAGGARATLVRVRPWFKDRRLRKLAAMQPQQIHRTAEETVHHA